MALSLDTNVKAYVRQHHPASKAIPEHYGYLTSVARKADPLAPMSQSSAA